MACENSERKDVESLTLAFAAVSAIGIAQAVVMCLHTYENARFSRSRRSRAPGSFAPQVELIIPCKGVEPELGLLVKMALEIIPPSAPSSPACGR